MGITRRGFLGGLIAGALTTLIPSEASARSWLKIQYGLYKNPITRKNEVALKVPLREGVSYALMSQLYTGTEANTQTIMWFNGNARLMYDKDNPRYMWIPKNLLKHSLIKIFDQNQFSTFEIENEEEEGDQRISTLWAIADGFMDGGLDIPEKINILLVLNDEINPIKKIVYNGQKILVPDALINRDIVETPEPKPEQPTPKPSKEKDPKPNAKKQNPYRIDLTDLKLHLRKKDRYGARRTRGSGKKFRISKHTGVDLAAAVGTKLYPIEAGIVIFAAKDKKRWRNGKRVSYITNSGLEVTYLHLSEISVKVGQKIDLTTLVGKVGITGNASANNPHVHVQVKVREKVVNPEPYILIDT